MLMLPQIYIYIQYNQYIYSNMYIYIHILWIDLAVTGFNPSPVLLSGVPVFSKRYQVRIALYDYIPAEGEEAKKIVRCPRAWDFRFSTLW